MSKVLRTWTENNKPWEEVIIPCTRCGGSGRYSWNPQDQDRCFRCRGKGTEVISRRILSDKEQAQRERAKQRKAEKRAEKQKEFQANSFTRFKTELGFENDEIHIVNLPDTFSIKDELRGAGAKFNHTFGWHFSQPNSNYPTITLTAEESFHSEQLVDYIEDVIQSKKGVSGAYYGSIGDKITVTLTLSNYFSYDGSYGLQFIYLFQDQDQNTFKWSTSKVIGPEIGESVTLTGTIKNHEQYKGVRQTVITRCKIKS